MQVPNQLIQIVTEPYQLAINELMMIILGPSVRGNALFFL
jgi:hypothetical protein